MRKVRLSLIITVFNEQSTIASFIESVLGQSKLPDEFIIVDGGSTDNTVSRIKNSKLKIQNYNVKFKIIIKKGNRSVGRNEAIRNANNEIILCSDSGCVLDKNWIRNISEPFKNPEIDVVSGYYKAIVNNIFEKCLSTYTCIMSDRLNPDKFLPSSRSIAFKKSVWMKVGKYPENLDTCEDLVFASRLKKSGFKFALAKNAVAKWNQKKNLIEAFSQFFNYAKGDGMARYFRPTTYFLFGRYIIGVYLLLLFFIVKSLILMYGIIIGVFAYIIWSVIKNYRYIKDIRAFFLLPLLQITSDAAVLLATPLGAIKSINITLLIKNNKSLTLLIGIYAACMALLINWGIPGVSHPFNYFMDEWHQAQSVRNVFSQGSPNVEGSANGSMFHFFLSGIFLAPFIAFGIINPFLIKSSVDSLGMQQGLFEALRLNTLLFGVLSIILIAYIAIKYFKFNPFLTAFLFVVNPIFLTLSNYFKYDIALIFWIILSFLFLFKYSLKPNSANFFLGMFFSGVAFSVKVSAIPLLPICISSFLLFNKNWRKKIGELVGGLFIFFCTFLLFGIPDILLIKGNISEYLYDNLIITPSFGQNYILDMPYFIYLIIKGVPSVFGIFLSLFSFFGFIFLVMNVFKKKLTDPRRNLYMLVFVSLIFFIASLVILQIEARGNRLLVLLPFIALLASLFVERTLAYSKILRKTFISILIIFLLFQTAESLSWIYMKLQIDPRQKSSEWILNNVSPKSTIGIENIPIYQSLPDIVLKEYYLKQHYSNYPARFSYQVVDYTFSHLPEYFVISNEEAALHYLKHSLKKSLIYKLRASNYKKIFTATADFSFLKFFRNERDYFMSGLIQTPTSISIYKKPN